MPSLSRHRNLVSYGVALCKCGIDMVDHNVDDEPWGDYPIEEPREDHLFDAAGTKHRCETWVPDLKAFCPRPRYHQKHDVPCGPLTGEKLWSDH